MEGRKLNISQPIPSVRRFKKDQKSKLINYSSNRPPLSSHKSELKSGPITNPGTVPFIWEQSPGRPKCENMPENFDTVRPKMDTILPRGKHLTAKTKSCDNNLAKLEEESDLDNGIDIDTADSISQTEWLSLNCSSSGVSGIDGQDLKRSTNEMTRDHMMGRFLPAAKAMAKETPQYSQWKHDDNKKYPVRGGSHVVLGLENDNKIQDGAHVVLNFPVETEEQENNDEYVKCRKSQLRVCQKLPGLCFLNPILPRKLQVPIPRVHIAKRSIFQKRKKSQGIHGEGNNDDLGSKAVERTLYIDTIHKVESQSKVKPSLRKNNIKILARNGRIKDTHLIDSCKDASLLLIEEEVIAMQLKDRRIQELGGNDDFLQDLIDLKNKREDRFISFDLPVPPPLPKSPTDSWLCRTLPPTSSKNLSARSITTTSDLELKTNDDTIKTQNLDLQFSKEPLMPIPETE